MRWLCWVIGLTALASVSYAHASAQDPQAWQAAVVFEAPPSCPDRGVLLERLDAAVGGVEGYASSERWGVWIRVVEPAPGVYRAEVRTLIAGVAGERSVDRSDCSGAVDAAVLVVALGLFDADPPAPEETDAPLASAPPDASEDPAAHASNDASAEPGPAGPGAWLGAGAGVSWGPMPDVAALAAIDLDFGLDAWRVGVGVRGLPHGAVYAVDQSAAVELGVVAASPHACLEARVGVLALGGCVAIDVGVLIAAGSGLDGARTVILPWLSIGGEAIAAWVIDEWVRIQAVVMGAWVPTRPRLSIGTVVVHQPEPVELGGLFALAFRLDERSVQ